MFDASQVERVIRHLVRFGSSRADAEDLAQDALVIAWRKQGTLDRDRSLDAWLYGIARNVHRNHARSERRRPMTDEPVEPTADARDLATVVAFRDALAALPEAQQDIVILHELEDYTLKETASILEIPFDTAKDRLRRARETLRVQLQGDVAAAAASERRATSQIAKAAAPAVLAGVLAVASRTALAAGAALTSKLLLGGMLALGVVVGVVADRVIAPAHTPSQPAAVTARAPLPIAPDAALAPPDAPPDAPDAIADARDAAAPPSPAASSAATDPEAQLIERARVALRRGSADEALRTLMSHERRFPAGQLAEERDVLLVEAYIAAGNLTLARERLDAYRRAYPDGLHRERADAAAKLLAPR